MLSLLIRPEGVLRRLVAIWLLGFTCMAGTATADTDWWSVGKDWLGGVGKQVADGNALTTDELTAGLKDALRVGTENVVERLGRIDGFNADPRIHIPLPQSLVTVQSTLSSLGMAQMLDELELRLNRAAEAATPEAKRLFWKGVEEMTLEDVKGIYSGPDDAATQYFRRKMSSQLAREMRPIVDQTLAEVGAVATYDQIMGRYRTLPFVPDVRADLTDYVVERGMDGIFYYLGREEAAIRTDPAKRTTELLQRVFGRAQ